MPLFLLGILSVSGCTATTYAAKQKKTTFHEICFYPAALPKTATPRNIQDAANVFIEQNEKDGNPIIDSFVINNNICFFMHRAKFVFPQNYQNTATPETSYILSSTFSGSSISRYTIRFGKNITAKDTYSLDEKLPLLPAIGEGIRIVASPRKLLRFFRRLKKLSYCVTVGILASGEVALQSNSAETARSILLLWKSDKLSLDKPVPGEYAITASASPVEKEAVTIFEPEWTLETQPTGFRAEGVKLLFSTGPLNSPWDSEHILRFLYALAYSHLQSQTDSLLFSPQILGVTPVVKSTLLSSELFFPHISTLHPPETFYWIKGVDKECEKLPPAFYANLLSLKMAKKIFTGSSRFLGGKGLRGPADRVDFLEMKKYFFRKEGLYGETFGTMKLYQYSGEILFESTMISEEQPKPFKAYFGKREKSTQKTIISFLVVGKDSNTLVDDIEKMVQSSSHTKIIQRLHEELSDSIGWATLSLLILSKNEQEMLNLYKRLTTNEHNKSIYLGVYRVKEEE